ncbi:hypothetical protein NDU88_006086 [Pleurodeles waltl]|uniref:Uncharacterized protein n=1 Tax=Pleurodeles waltl TaxID=8319 RepID=A0AAV7SNT7_PLEWA|nr:hypothetical protein NDU88_006086 [Pleurodeles waltl]
MSGKRCRCYGDAVNVILGCKDSVHHHLEVLWGPTDGGEKHEGTEHARGSLRGCSEASDVQDVTPAAVALQHRTPDLQRKLRSGVRED